MKNEVTVSSSTGFRKGAVLCINGGDDLFIVQDVTSTTLTIHPQRWWHRLWAWMRSLWPFRLWR